MNHSAIFRNKMQFNRKTHKVISERCYFSHKIWDSRDLKYIRNFDIWAIHQVNWLLWFYANQIFCSHICQMNFQMKLEIVINLISRINLIIFNLNECAWSEKKNLRIKVLKQILSMPIIIEMPFFVRLNFWTYTYVICIQLTLSAWFIFQHWSIRHRIAKYALLERFLWIVLVI